jgi:hypothetical protein
VSLGHASEIVKLTADALVLVQKYGLSDSTLASDQDVFLWPARGKALNEISESLKLFIPPLEDWRFRPCVGRIWIG